METTKLVKAFENELNLTEQGFLDLIEQKKDLVIDVSTDEGFKLARKERTEQNKILERIDRLAIDGKKSVDEARQSLKDRVSNIYAPTVTAFEAEDIRRKEEAARKKREEEERIQGIRNEINSMRRFSNDLFGKPSEELQSIIEAVDMIDVSENFAELTQEALTVKKEVLAELNQALASAIQSEQLEAERQNLRKEREAQEEQNRINELKAKSQERLNNFVMIPTTMFGKSSDEIKVKITSIENFEIKEDEFGELCDQANASVGNVVSQLRMMLEQQLIVEKAQAEEREKVETYQQAKADLQAEAERVAEDSVSDKEDENPMLQGLKYEAYEAHKKAEQKWHAYACELPIGDERVIAFEIYENIRLAIRKS